MAGALLEAVDEQLEVHRALPVHAVVLDVGRPRLAFNVDEDAGRRLHEVDKDERRQVAGLVGEGKILVLDALRRVVVHRSDVLLVSRILQKSTIRARIKHNKYNS